MWPVKINNFNNFKKNRELRLKIFGESRKFTGIEKIFENLMKFIRN